MNKRAAGHSGLSERILALSLPMCFLPVVRSGMFSHAVCTVPVLFCICTEGDTFSLDRR